MLSHAKMAQIVLIMSDHKSKKFKFLLSYLPLFYLPYLAKSDNRKVPNMDVLRKHLLREGHLNKPELVEIIQEATNILSK